MWLKVVGNILLMEYPLFSAFQMKAVSTLISDLEQCAP